MYGTFVRPMFCEYVDNLDVELIDLFWSKVDYRRIVEWKQRYPVDRDRAREFTFQLSNFGQTLFDVFMELLLEHQPQLVHDDYM